jgi:hypothetical protein
MQSLKDMQRDNGSTEYILKKSGYSVKAIGDAENIQPEDIMEHLGGVPEHKRDCILLARATLNRALRLHRRENSNR